MLVANQNTTIEWWETRRSNFNLFVSEFVVTEASLGNPDAAKKRLEVNGGLGYVERSYRRKNTEIT